MIFRRTRIGAYAALLVTIARLFVIDIDPPVRDLTDYLAKDEAFYVFPAYDLYEQGETFSTWAAQSRSSFAIIVSRLCWAAATRSI